MPVSLTQGHGIDLALDDDSGVFTSKQVNGLVDFNVRHFQSSLVLLVFLAIT